nr:putative cytokinetic ring protein SteA [Candidatus Aquicultor secundus]
MDSSKELLDKKVEVPADGVNKKLPAHDNLEIDILRSDLQSDLQSDLPSDSQRSDRPGVQVPDRESEKAGSMFYEGVAKLDKRTKKLVKRLKPGDIAIIDHEDLDRVTAEAVVETGVEVVINASCFTSGKYPNTGPLILCSAGIHLLDNVGAEIFEKIKEGAKLSIRGEEIYCNGTRITSGKKLTHMILEQEIEKAHSRIGEELERFAVNTLEYMQKEKELILDGSRVPETRVDFKGRHALIVVRGYDYKPDLKALRAYIREVKPILIGVDGGADALIEEGYKPDIIIGDMDSVVDDTLRSGAELIVHAYPGGKAPGLKRLNDLGLSPITFEAVGTSEDIAMILAYEHGCELIVAVGTHANLVEFLDKGRKGMSSTFLVRLKVGSKLVDAKGVNKLYRSSVKISHLVVLLFAGMSAIIAIVMAAPSIRQSIRLLLIQIKLMLGL